MSRFVVLHHQLPEHAERPSHWDLMLAVDGALRTWALDGPPAPGVTRRAEPLADHRLAYLDYEGPVSGDRGEVRRIEEGTYEPLEFGPDRWVVKLAGRHYQGIATLRRGAGDANWQVEFA